VDIGVTKMGKAMIERGIRQKIWRDPDFLRSLFTPSSRLANAPLRAPSPLDTTQTFDCAPRGEAGETI
jgi:hypothetical protein